MTLLGTLDLAALVGSAAERKGQKAGATVKIASKPVPQPIAFSHKAHAAVTTCLFCHAKAATEERAGVPGVDLCMQCHNQVKKDSPAIQKLAAYQNDNQPVPWARVYRLPDFAVFSHATHVGAKIGCPACHGLVAQRAVLSEEVPARMKTCVDCHKVRQVSIECTLCHELGH